MNSPSNSPAKSVTAFTLSVSTLALAFIAAYLCASDPMFRAMMKLSRQSDVMAQRYFGDISAETAFNDAWESMQRSLPFRVELVSESSHQTESRSTENWGLTLSSEEGTASVVAVAEKSLFTGALQSGDKLIAVGRDTGHLVTSLQRHLSSPTGDSLLIRFERSGLPESVKVFVPPVDRHPLATFDVLEGIAYCALHVLSEHVSDLVSDSLGTIVVDSTKGIVIDLRNCDDGDNSEVDKLARVFRNLRSSLPLVLIVDETAGREAQVLGVRILERKYVAIAGTLELLLHPVTDIIPLRTGSRLYVYHDERNESYFLDKQPSRPESTRLPEDTVIARNEGSSTTEIECGRRYVSGMVIDLLRRNLFLDFVAASSYLVLPPPQDEGRLLAEFEAFLRNRGYSYDPLGEAFQDLEHSAHSAEEQQAVAGIRKTLLSLPPARLEDDRADIIQLLLAHIQEVKIGGEPSLAARLRLDDYCLQAAFAHLRGPRT